MRSAGKCLSERSFLVCAGRKALCAPLCFSRSYEAAWPQSMKPTPCPSHPASSCCVHEHGLLSPSAPHFLLEEAREQPLVFQSPPGSGLSTDWGVGASCAPTCFLISQPLLAARLDGRMGPVGRPRSQRKEQAGAEAGDGDLDGLESRTAVGTLIDDTGVGAQRRQGSGELC